MQPAPRKTVLVVNSSPAVNSMLTRALSKVGCEVQRAVDNKTVLSLAKEMPFDLIITGQSTSTREDVKLLHEIRKVRPEARMIILTDERTPGEVVDAIRAGAFSYFCPPYTEHGLAEMVHLAMNEPGYTEGIEIVSATPSWVRLIVRADVPTADRLVQFLRAGSTLPEAEKEDVVSAFHEILLNAMEHGAHFDPTQYVEVAFFRGQHVVVCRVKDPGEGFSLDELHHVAKDTSVDDLLHCLAVREQQGLRPGGFGVMLSKKLVDEVVYNEKGNDVLLVKYLNLPPLPLDQAPRSA
jgi:DNA-binding NarL/FixJ family response regulator